jgi:hypothetical protein
MAELLIRAHELINADPVGAFALACGCLLVVLLRRRRI